MLKNRYSEMWESILEDCLTEHGYMTFRLDMSEEKKLKKCNGSMISVTVEGRKEREFKIEHYILKTKLETEDKNEMFATESYVYNQVLPKFKNLQKDLPESYKIGFPTCLKACDQYVIMEDLTMKNFVVDSVLDYERVAFACMELARFHSLSMVMKQQQQEDFNNMKNYLNKEVFHYIEINETNLNRHLKQILEAINSTTLKDILQNSSKDLVQTVNKIQSNVDDKHFVITHGNYFYKNILFTCDEDDEPSDMIMLDFQMSCYASPVLDFLYLLFTSAQKNVIMQYERLIDVYYDSIRMFLKKFQCKIEECYPKQAYLNDLKKYFPCVFIKLLYTAGDIFEECDFDERISEIFECIFELNLI